MRVLIIDDEPHILRHLGSALRKANCEVHTASSIEDARRLLLSNQFDYAIVDLKLDAAYGFGGIEILKSAKLSNVKSIVLSGYTFEQVEEQLKKQQGRLDETEDLLRAIAINYIYKGNAVNYIEAVFRKLEIEDTTLALIGSYHALLIAVQEYGDNRVKNLNYPITDAGKLHDILTGYYTFDINSTKTLVNPARHDIISELYKLSDKLTSRDNLLIFYAGHGCWDDDRQQGYWLPRDAIDHNPANWISNGDIRDFIRGTKTQHTLLVSDACFSGAIFKPRHSAVSSGTIREKYRTPSRRAITSGSATQAVPDRSVFLDYLIKHLKNNREQHLYAEKLFVNICDEFVFNDLTEQNPVYGSILSTGDDVGGDFIFVRR